MTKGQNLAIEQLREIEAVAPGLLELVEVSELESGWLRIELSVYCGNFKKEPEGLPLRARERFCVHVPPDFPFEVPSVEVRHDRFAGFPHVQWKHHLCLYISQATEWNPSDGMFGFIERLEDWLKHAALNQLDPIGAPQHPPVAYVSGQYRTVIPHADTPPVSGNTWFGVAHINVVSDHRFDITGWSELFGESPSPVAAAILLSEPMPFEFPSNLSDLMTELETRGVSREKLFSVLQQAVSKNEEGTPFILVIGTPMRGIRGSNNLKQHLAAWYVNPTMADGLRLSISEQTDTQEILEIRKRIDQIIKEWMEIAPVEWCLVRENRPEVVTRRDQGSPVAWFAGKTVSLWGCGALGSRVAEFLARAGAKKLILRDKGIVAPGLLVRQPFDDQDIGQAKARVLAEQLKRMRPDLEVEYHTRSILADPLESRDWTDGADIIIDTTAAIVVTHKLELVRRDSPIAPIPIASMIVGHRAKNGLAVLASENHSGGPSDVFRRAKIEACSHPTLTEFADEFWPSSPRNEPFQPEPGCSENTFVGSAADVTVLAGSMLNKIAQSLANDTDDTAFAHFISAPHIATASGKSTADFSWTPDRIHSDPHANYEVRIAQSAWSEIIAWTKQNSRTGDFRVETGGLLFGERDDVSCIVWVTEAIGPPPDSQKSEQGFICGTAGVDAANQEKERRTRGAVQYVGMWHTHPNIDPLPSSTDFEGMERILNSTERPASKSLLLIVGTQETTDRFSIGAVVFKRSDFSKAHTFNFRVCAVHAAATQHKPRRIGLALSGGGSRAIAFHLGCLRALNDRGILDQIQVISTVSGGSVIGAMYTYSSGPFEDFDRRVIKLLRRGLFGGIVRRAVFSPLLLKSAATLGVSGMAAIGSDILRSVLLAGNRLFGQQNQETIDWIDRIQPPLRRWVNRTSAFVDTLRHEVLGDKKLTSNRRDNIEIVINACELRTGSAFRFGSKESACWRFGRILDNDVSVAQAVAASAAYPVLLPAIDCNFTFVDRNGNNSSDRVMLTDGGVYDNLGITCLEPGRSSDFSYNVFHPEYIIGCVAEQGLFSDHVYPYWWVPRMTRSFESIFRKVQNSGYQRLHEYAASGALKGFIMPYLGQQDKSLPCRPPDLVRREDVSNYPTDFSPMGKDDIERLTKRGEQLTRLLIAQHTPEL